jgi:hypothetical protein
MIEDLLIAGKIRASVRPGIWGSDPAIALLSGFLDEYATAGNSVDEAPQLRPIQDSIIDRFAARWLLMVS